MIGHDYAQPTDEEIDPDHEPEPDVLADLRTGDWLDTQTFPPVAWAVPGVIPEGLTLLVGPPKAGKSWLVLATALACSTGGRALGQIPVPQRPVLYLALEDGDRRMQDRCRQLLDVPLPSAFTYMTRVAPGNLLAVIEAWLSRYGDNSLIILDTLGKVMPPAAAGESAYQRDYRIGSAFKEITARHPGLAVVIVHHDRKAVSDDFVDSVSGTNGLAGAADTIVVLARKRRETAGLIQVTGRDVDENAYGVVFQQGAWMLDGRDLGEAAAAAVERQETEGVGDAMAQVVRAVTRSPVPMRPADVVQATGMDAKSVGVYLPRAVSAGRLDKVGRGLYIGVGSVGSVGNGGTASPTAPPAPHTHRTSNTSNTSNTSAGDPYADVPPDESAEPPDEDHGNVIDFGRSHT